MSNERRQLLLQLAELRAKIPLYREYTDDQIAMGMMRMQNSWGWVAESELAGKVGVLAQEDHPARRARLPAAFDHHGATLRSRPRVYWRPVSP